jgi:hypothetical protein
VDPVQGEVLRDEVAFAEEMVLLDSDGPEVNVDGSQDLPQAIAALGTGGVVHHVRGDEIIQRAVVTRLLPSGCPAGPLDQRSIGSPGLSEKFAATEVHALCEGLAALELRGQLAMGDDNEHIWRDALTALVLGFSAASRHPNQKTAAADRINRPHGAASGRSDIL